MKQPTLSPRSNAYRQSAQAMGFHTVCLIGWEGPRPAYFGDNRGVWPVRAATAAREMTAHERSDLESPHVGVVVLEYVVVPSATHARRLKEALDEVLLGQQEEQQNNGLRHRWRDVRGCFEEDDDTARLLWWGTVLQEALRIVANGATEFPIYDSWEQARSTISRRALKGH